MASQAAVAGPRKNLSHRESRCRAGASKLAARDVRSAVPSRSEDELAETAAVTPGTGAHELSRTTTADTAAACRRLDIHLVLGTAAYPEGHGKIEKFNQTAQAQVLRGLTGAADVDDDCGALEIDPFGIPLERSVERLDDRCFRSLRGVMMLDAPSTPYRGRLRM